MYRSSVLAALAATFVLCVPTQTVAHPACKPLLTFKEVRFSEAQNQQRKWTAILAVDASRCSASSGPFEIKFVRLKEVGPDLLRHVDARTSKSALWLSPALHQRRSNWIASSPLPPLGASRFQSGELGLDESGHLPPAVIRAARRTWVRFVT